MSQVCHQIGEYVVSWADTHFTDIAGHSMTFIYIFHHAVITDEGHFIPAIMPHAVSKLEQSTLF